MLLATLFSETQYFLDDLEGTIMLTHASLSQLS